MNKYIKKYIASRLVFRLIHLKCFGLQGNKPLSTCRCFSGWLHWTDVCVFTSLVAFRRMSAGYPGQRRVSEALVRMPQEQRQENRALACSAQRQHGPIWRVASAPAPPVPYPAPYCIVPPVEYCLPVRQRHLGLMYSNCPKSAKVPATTPTHPKKKQKKQQCFFRWPSGMLMTLWLESSQRQLCDALMWWRQSRTANLIIAPRANCSLRSPRFTEQMSCPGPCLRAQVRRELPPLTSARFFLFFLPSVWIGAPIEWDLPFCRLLICVGVTNSCIIGCLFTSLVSLSSLRRLAVKKSPHGHYEMHLPHQTKFQYAEKCLCMMFHCSRWGKQIYVYRRLHTLSPLLILMQCFCRRSSHEILQPRGQRFCCVLALMHVCWRARTPLFNKGITTPAALVFLYYTRMLVDGGKPRLNRPRFQPITAGRHAVGD